MSRLRMNWDWVRGHKVMVFSELLKPDGPRGTVNANSHAEVFAACARYADRKMAEARRVL